MDSRITACILGAALSGAITGCSSNNAAQSTTSNGDGGINVDAGVGGNGDGGCVSGATVACTSFTTPTGITLQLGPYGAQMDPNVGTGFENPVDSEDEPDAAAYCENFAKIFAQSAALTAQLLNTSQDGIDLNFALYSAYRPATWPSTPIPVITWGNGTCAQPEGYGALLRYIASYGFFIIAANSREVSTGTPMLHALDYAASANEDTTSPYYHKLDLTRVGAMGHSQGGMATVNAAADPRVLYAVIFNAADSCSKPFLAYSGDKDITGFTASGMMSAIDSSSVPAAYLYYYDPIGTGPNGGGNLDGHLVLMTQPNRVAPPAAEWWQMVFNNDPTATADFVGTGSACAVCEGQAPDAGNYQYGNNGMLPPSTSEAGAPVEAGATDGGPTDAGATPEAATTSPEAAAGDQ
jgi:hypothetical protein